MSTIHSGINLLAMLSLAGCSGHAAGQVAQLDTDHGSIDEIPACTRPGAEKFRVQLKDTLFPGRYGGYGAPSGDLVKLTPGEREHLLKGSAKDYADAELYFFSIIRCEPQMKEVTLLSSHFDGTDILWLAYMRRITVIISATFAEIKRIFVRIAHGVLYPSTQRLAPFHLG